MHIDHGIGRYLGLQTLNVGEHEEEYLHLEYAGNDKLYVPVSSLHLIGRYSGADPDTAPLHKLGNDRWSKSKEKAAKKVSDVAAELLDIYAIREARSGFGFDFAEDHYQRFAAQFPFETTDDQERAINAVVEDMRTAKSMDRLICGDVGFGKTEVAMRAAFLAASNNKQVIVLVPTTLLANQHFQTFRDRFAKQAITIEMLSRFRSKAEQDAIIKKLKAGTVDIIIGTHKLLSPEIAYKDLGLVIIDEEHRFGVKQKEKLKMLRAEVDILTLTATPIPRTLNMALADIRDLSIIATPPARRLSIKTFVQERNKAIMREAILREILRGGQIFFLHNKVETIEKTARDIAELIPEARVVVAHGQMPERQLERVMAEFYRQHYNVLVCTTIIENGIDIPSANTIIIDRADRFGLAQLHQLRGRVGRSHHQAYAYLLTPPKKLMSTDAHKRLEAISSLEDLGVGFSLASHDLEIRGAGELLGDEQSGHIQEVGFSLYMQLLERAVAALKAGKTPSTSGPLLREAEVNCQMTALIPDNYIMDVHTRLLLYKRIASANTPEALDDIRVEMIDRFGKLPEATTTLFNVTKLKLHALPLGIDKIVANSDAIRLEFSESTPLSPQTLIGLVQNDPDHFQFAGNNGLRYNKMSQANNERIELVDALINRLRKTTESNDGQTTSH